MEKFASLGDVSTPFKIRGKCCIHFVSSSTLFVYQRINYFLFFELTFSIGLCGCETGFRREESLSLCCIWNLSWRTITPKGETTNDSNCSLCNYTNMESRHYLWYSSLFFTFSMFSDIDFFLCWQNNNKRSHKEQIRNWKEQKHKKQTNSVNISSDTKKDAMNWYYYIIYIGVKIVDYSLWQNRNQ